MRARWIVAHRVRSERDDAVLRGLLALNQHPQFVTTALCVGAVRYVEMQTAFGAAADEIPLRASAQIRQLADIR